MKSIYDKHGYKAKVDYTGTVVVTRPKAGGDIHIGEKHTSQDWREVTLCGCSTELRQEIMEAHLTYLREQLQ